MTAKKKENEDLEKKDAAVKPEGEAKAAPKKKAAARKPSKGKKKDEHEPTVVQTKAEVRETQEQGSIAPPTTQLVDAFAKYRKSPHRPSSGAPVVARIAECICSSASPWKPMDSSVKPEMESRRRRMTIFSP